MNGRRGIPLVLLAGALIATGIVLGAATQKETFIGNEVRDQTAVGSDITAITGFLVGLGVGIGVHALGLGSQRDRWAGAMVAGAAAWIMTFLVQLALPNYIAIPEHGIANIHSSNLLLEAEASPSVPFPVLALGILLMSACAWAILRSNADTAWLPSLSIVRRDHMAIAALAIPVLVIMASGMVRVMLDMAPDQEGAGLVTLLHPIAAAACVMLAVTIVVRARIVARLRHDPGTVDDAQASWTALDRLDWIAIGALGLVAVLSTFLPADPTEATSAGRTLLFTLRSHGQGVAFLAVVLLPLHALHRRMRPLLADAPNHPIPIGQPNRAVLAFILVLTAACLMGIVATFASGLAMMPWILALVPSAIVASIVGRPTSSALVRLVAAWVMWAKGNTLIATYDAQSYPDLLFLTHPGMLAMWRMGAAAFVGWVVFDVLRELGDEQRPQVVVPLAAVAAVGVSITGLLELPLNVWPDIQQQTHQLSVGSLVASQQTGVRVVMHLLTFAACIGSAAAASRIIRPDWFQRPPPEPRTVAVASPT